MTAPYRWRGTHSTATTRDGTTTCDTCGTVIAPGWRALDEHRAGIDTEIEAIAGMSVAEVVAAVHEYRSHPRTGDTR